MLRELLLLLPIAAVAQQPSALLQSARGVVSFVSDAPLERLEATNDRATAVIDTRDRSFAVQVPMTAFFGFNNPLQQEHFNENYLESTAFPMATFDGKIIENVDLSVPGTYTVRAKGKFTVHGIERERIIACAVTVTAEGVRVKSVLEVTLADHDIRIPGVVRQKIAPVVIVTVDLLFHTAKPKG